LITLNGTSNHTHCYNITPINVSQGKQVLFIGYVNDSSGNVNSSRVTVTVANTVPTHTTPIINSTDL